MGYVDGSISPPPATLPVAAEGTTATPTVTIPNPDFERIQLRKLTSSTEPHTALYVGRGRGRSPNLSRGANAHVTLDLSRLYSHTPYSGIEIVTSAGGHPLPIAHVDSDNNYTLVSNPSEFQILDNKTHRSSFLYKVSTDHPTSSSSYFGVLSLFPHFPTITSNLAHMPLDTQPVGYTPTTTPSNLPETQSIHTPPPETQFANPTHLLDASPIQPASPPPSPELPANPNPSIITPLVS
nr:hypothetical protein Iba_chr07dCG7730 [Ipomoea batatas]